MPYLPVNLPEWLFFDDVKASPSTNFLVLNRIRSKSLDVKACVNNFFQLMLYLSVGNIKSEFKTYLV